MESQVAASPQLLSEPTLRSWGLRQTRGGSVEAVLKLSTYAVAPNSDTEGKAVGCSQLGEIWAAAGPEMEINAASAQAEKVGTLTRDIGTLIRARIQTVDLPSEGWPS